MDIRACLDMMRPALLLVLAIWAEPLSACVCWQPPPKQLIESHALIFKGRVESVMVLQRAAPFGWGRVRIRVDSVYKGELNESAVDIHYSVGGECGVNFSVGAPETIFANVVDRAGEATLYTGFCSMFSYRSAPVRFQSLLDTFKSAIGDARAATQAHPDSVSAWLKFVQVQEELGDYRGAVASLDRLRMLAPHDTRFSARQGQALLALGRTDEALSAYNAALTLDRNNVLAKRGRQQILVKLGRIDQIDPAWRDFSSMEFDRTDFSRRKLDGVRFAKSRLFSVRFNAGQLPGADFSEADLQRADFSDSDLRSAKFAGIASYETKMSRSKLAGASFVDAKLFHASFDKADLRQADFNGAILENTSFTGANLAGARFGAAKLSGTDFSGTDLSGKDFHGLEMQGIALRGAKLVNANLGGAYLFGGDIPGRGGVSATPVKPADLRGADFSGANLKGADFRYALFDCKTKWPAGLDIGALILIPVTSKECPGPPPRTALFARWGEAFDVREHASGPALEKLDLASVDLSGANLSGFRLAGANLHDATLRDVDLRNSDLQASDLRGADLRGANLAGARLAEARLDNARYDDRTRWPDGFNPKRSGAWAERKLARNRSPNILSLHP